MIVVQNRKLISLLFSWHISASDWCCKNGRWFRGKGCRYPLDTGHTLPGGHTTRRRCRFTFLGTWGRGGANSVVFWGANQECVLWRVASCRSDWCLFWIFSSECSGYWSSPSSPTAPQISSTAGTKCFTCTFFSVGWVWATWRHIFIGNKSSLANWFIEFARKLGLLPSPAKEASSQTSFSPPSETTLRGWWVSSTFS